jgi:hypothetical protein
MDHILYGIMAGRFDPCTAVSWGWFSGTSLLTLSCFSPESSSSIILVQQLIVWIHRCDSSMSLGKAKGKYIGVCRLSALTARLEMLQLKYLEGLKDPYTW